LQAGRSEIASQIDFCGCQRGEIESEARSLQINAIWTWRAKNKKKSAHLQLKTQRLVEADGGEFGRRVVDQFVDADQAGETGHGHNVAIVRVNHVREERLGSLKHKGKILHLKLSMRSWII
jgi:hypothetical protein